MNDSLLSSTFPLCSQERSCFGNVQSLEAVCIGYEVQQVQAYINGGEYRTSEDECNNSVLRWRLLMRVEMLSVCQTLLYAYSL